jgi:hypothetical protein
LKLWIGGRQAQEGFVDHGFTFSQMSQCFDGVLTWFGPQQLPDGMRVEGEGDIPCPY